MSELTEEQRHIGGYSLILPNTMDQLGYARIALLIKEDITNKILKQFMRPATSCIWISLGGKGRKALVLGGIYREHTLLRQGPGGTSDNPNQQLARWNKLLEGWRDAAEGNPNCVIVGDTNLDFNNWNSPDHNVARMTERTKKEIETKCFTQLVRTVTRSWPGQVDSDLGKLS